MRLPIAIPLLCTVLPLTAQDNDPDKDLLRFVNGDSLHGRFAGITEGPVVQWTGSSVAKPMELQTDKLRRVAFNGGRARKSLQTPSFITLPNGDRIPGTIVSIDAENVTIDSAISGTITIPRENVVGVSPNPHGGIVHYVGPFTPDGWEIIDKSKSQPDEGLELNTPGEAAHQDQQDENESEEDPWVFGGGAWYSNSQLPIAIDAHIPDTARIAFRLGWRNRLSAIVSFHSTLKVPEPPKEEEKGDEGEDEAAPQAAIKRIVRGTSSSSYPYTYGHSYVLTIYSSYAMLYRCDFNEQAQPILNRLSSSSANVRLTESGDADFELRCDRKTGSIVLFVNGRFVSQWEDADGYVGSGSNLTFACNNSSSRLRVSDVVVNSWNGMLDSARSMDSEKSDVVLLTNGTDRFSGELLSVTNGQLHLQGAYAEFNIPIEDVQEIRFAREDITELPEPSENAVRLRLQPVGRVTVEPISATPTTMKSRSAALGEIDIDLGYTSILDFSFSDSILDNWDDDF